MYLDFRCVLASLYEGLSVRRSVDPFVTRFHRIRENACFQLLRLLGVGEGKGNDEGGGEGGDE